MGNLNIQGNVSAGRDINITQDSSIIYNKYAKYIEEATKDDVELKELVTNISIQLTELLNSNKLISDNKKETNSLLDNLKKLGSKSMELLVATAGNVLHNVLQKYT